LRKQAPALLSVIDVLTIFSVLSLSYLINLSTADKILLLIAVTALSINFYVIKLRVSAEAPPLWLIPLLVLLKVLLENFLGIEFTLLLLYIVVLLASVLNNVSSIEALERIRYLEMLLVVAVTSLIIQLIYNCRYVAWATLAPVAEFTLIYILRFRGLDSHGVARGLTTGLGAAAVTLIPQLPVYVLAAPLVLNLLKSMITGEKLVVTLIYLDYLLRLVVVVVLAWSTGML